MREENERHIYNSFLFLLSALGPHSSEMIIILPLPLRPILGQGGLGFPLVRPQPQLIIEVPRELDLRLPLLDIPWPVRRSGMHLRFFLNLENMLRTSVKVEQEQDQLIQQLEGVVWWDQDRPVSVIL